jgi:hypothetical protein
MEADAVAHVVEGNDTLNMPTPSQESLGAPWKTPARPKHEPMLRTLAFKQTMIPILLTMGVLLSGIAVWVFSLGEESPVAGATWIPAAVLGIGAVMLVFAVVTMLQVRGQMTASAGT